MKNINIGHHCIALLSVIFLVFSCVTVKEEPAPEPEKKAKESSDLVVSEDNTSLSFERCFYYDDRADGGASLVINEECDKGRLVLEGVVTTDLAWGFIGCGIDLDDEGKKRLSEGSGIRFMVRGDNKEYRLRLPVKSVKDYNYHGYVFRAPAEETAVSVLYSDLKQEDWGHAVGFDPDGIFQISFQTVGQPHDHVYMEVTGLEVITAQE
ncbi:MAG: CIA30 family protein [Spirochaetales bacterium]|nr:CIA30 family protein [Spirochaetales bacterium]